MDSATLSKQHENTISQWLEQLLNRFGSAIEFWPIACLSQSELGNANTFIDEHWNQFQQVLQNLRAELSDVPNLPPSATDQLAKLWKVAADLREIFDVFIDAQSYDLKEIELNVVRLGLLWRELRLRVILLAVLVPLSPPLPSLASEHEARYQSILDSLFDRFAANRRGDRSLLA